MEYLFLKIFTLAFTSHSQYEALLFSGTWYMKHGTRGTGQAY